MEFEVENLSYYEVERKICDCYNLGYANSSSFTELEIGKTKKITIHATKGILTCDVTANKKTNSNSYILSCGCVNISKKK